MLSEVARRPFWIFHWLSRMGVSRLLAVFPLIVRCPVRRDFSTAEGR